MGNALNADKLLANIADQILESQLKLGYVRETVRLYYKASSLAATLGFPVEEASAVDPHEVVGLLEKESALTSSSLGALTFGVHADRVEVNVPPEGVCYVHEQMPEPAFLKAVIEFFRSNHHASIDEVKGLFASFDENYRCEKMPDGFDFDYAMRLSEQAQDQSVYCVKDEMGHTIYHRFTPEDYAIMMQ